MNTCTVTTVHNSYTHLQFTLQFWFGVKYQKQWYPSYLFPCTKETLYPISALAYTLTPYNITACCWHNIVHVQWCFTKESTILTRNNQCSHKVYTVTMTTCIGSCIISLETWWSVLVSMTIHNINQPYCIISHQSYSRFTIWYQHQHSIANVGVTLELTQVQLQCCVTSISQHPTNHQHLLFSEIEFD